MFPNTINRFVISPLKIEILFSESKQKHPHLKKETVQDIRSIFRPEQIAHGNRL